MSLASSGPGVTRLKVGFNLHCPRGKRGPITKTATWSTPLPLTATAGVWGLAITYIGNNGWLYSINAMFPTVGPATGTLAITTNNGACKTRQLKWTANTT